MTPSWFQRVTECEWLEAASCSPNLAAAVELVGGVKYRTFYCWVRANRLDLLAAMRERLTTVVRDSQKPRCSEAGCQRHVKARDLCKLHYEQWLVTAPAEAKVRRAVYPTPDEIVAMYERFGSITAVAREIGVARKSLESWLERRPQVRCRLVKRDQLSQAEVRHRKIVAARSWRQRNPERVRAAKRRWARNRSPEHVRRWNVYNAQRRRDQVAASRGRDWLKADDSVTYRGVIATDPCVYCGLPAGTVDHIRPINTGGVDAWENYAPACWSCNSSKRDKELLTFLLWRVDRGSSGPGSCG